MPFKKKVALNRRVKIQEIHKMDSKNKYLIQISWNINNHLIKRIQLKISKTNMKPLMNKLRAKRRIKAK